jgi:[acyl-carrier-protein] S-malonyltransferase
MPEVAPASFKSRAGIKETSHDFEESWLKVPFETYEGMTQMAFQESISAYYCDGKKVPVTVPKGWRRVESSAPGKYFYVHMESGTISKFPKEIFSCPKKCWIAQDGTPLPADEIMMDPYMRAVKKGSNASPGNMQQVSESKPVMPEAIVQSSAGTLPVCLMFPGQGSQYVKMLSSVQDMPPVAEMLNKAKEILGYDLQEICLKGPESKLEQTKFCQPAMFVGGLAGMEKLKAEKPDRVARCQAVAGLSLGEYTALCVAGVFDFETGLKLVQLRGEAMQQEAEASPQSMLSVAGLSADTLSGLCEKAKSSPDDVCQIANILFPNGFTCGGHAGAVDRLLKLAQETEGVMQAKLLKTGGAFHTPLMKPAQEKLRAALKQFEPKFKSPRCDVYMNFSGTKITPATQPSEIISLLVDQLVNPVRWEPSCKEMIKDGVTEFYECGPMKQLKAMMKRIDKSSFDQMTTVDV